VFFWAIRRLVSDQRVREEHCGESDRPDVSRRQN